MLVNVELTNKGMLKAASRKAYPHLNDTHLFYLKHISQGKVTLEGVSKSKIVLSKDRLVFPEIYLDVINQALPAMRAVVDKYLESTGQSFWETDKTMTVTKS